MKTFGEKVMAFNRQLDFKGKLPPGISIMNPFKENPDVLPISDTFYKKYYSDHQPRFIILGINPGRFGGGITGIPFTDPKRLTEKCGISYSGKMAHEPSSVFVYDVIDAWGGAVDFYKHFYINSICPLGFTADTASNKVVNYNYYDSKALTSAALPFIIESLRQQLALGVNTDVCFCFGNGKNEHFLRNLNKEYQFFKEIIALEHPRFVMQYKSKEKQQYIDKYISAFQRITTFQKNTKSA